MLSMTHGNERTEDSRFDDVDAIDAIVDVKAGSTTCWPTAATTPISTVGSTTTTSSVNGDDA